MIREFIASFRLAIALVCVGVTLILSGQWLGFGPNAELVKTEGRQALCESIAINASGHVNLDQWVDLKTILRVQVERQTDLLSIGLRSDLGTLRLDTGHHAEMWPKSDVEVPSVVAVRIPITSNRRRWGDVEFCFEQPATTAFSAFNEHSIYRLVIFFTLAGLGFYTLFVARMMGVFSRTQVVPDRVRQALDTLAEGLLVLDEQGKIVLANRAFATTIGIESEELVSKTAADLAWSSPILRTPDKMYPWVGAITDGELQSDCILHYRLADGRNRIFSVNAAPLGGDDQSRGALATFRDVTHIEEHREELEKMLGMLRNSRDEIKKKNGELEILATQDALTGCLNRRAFFAAFEQLWTEAKANQTPLSCIMIDNDHFKNVNDTYGHHIGDEVLRRVSALIRRLHQKHGLVCRYGGEEFCVVLPNLSLRQAINEAEKTRKAISRIKFKEPTDLKLTASFGVSELRFDPSNTQELINQADCCLYVAKREGRNRVICFNKSMQTEADVADKPSAPAEAKSVNVSYQAVTALMSALSYRDARTAEHGRRVADLCARAAGRTLDPGRAYLLEVAALLHEIGKIGIPNSHCIKSNDAVSKRTTEKEVAAIDRQDRIGIEIIADAFNCDELTSLIKAHQQYRLRGVAAETAVANDVHADELSRWSAKLLTVADCYDTIVSEVVHQNEQAHSVGHRFAHTEAMTKLRRDAGSQFDPAVVEQFAAAIEDWAPMLTAGAFAVGKQAAIRIGLDVERLAEAIEKREMDNLKLYVDALAVTADSVGVDSIVQAARQIRSYGNSQQDNSQQDDSEQQQCDRLLIDIYRLLDVARGAQADFLRESLEQESRTSGDS